MRLRIIALLILSLPISPAFAKGIFYVDKKGTRHMVESEGEIPEEYRKKPPPPPAPRNYPARVLPKKEVKPIVVEGGSLPPEAPAENKQAAPGELAITERFKLIALKHLDEVKVAEAKLRSKTSQECLGKTSRLACYLEWVKGNPPRSNTQVVVLAATATSLALLDQKDTGDTGAYYLDFSEALVFTLERADPTLFELNTERVEGEAEKQEKKSLLALELEGVQTSRDKLCANVAKLLAQYEEKRLPSAVTAEKKRFEALKARLEKLKAKTFSF